MAIHIFLTNPYKRLKIPQIQVKLQQPSTKLKLKFKRQVHYFQGWLGGWCGRIENKATYSMFLTLPPLPFRVSACKYFGSDPPAPKCADVILERSQISGE